MARIYLDQDFCCFLHNLLSKTDEVQFIIIWQNITYKITRLSHAKCARFTQSAWCEPTIKYDSFSLDCTQVKLATGSLKLSLETSSVNAMNWPVAYSKVLQYVPAPPHPHEAPPPPHPTSTPFRATAPVWIDAFL